MALIICALLIALGEGSGVVAGRGLLDARSPFGFRSFFDFKPLKITDKQSLQAYLDSPPRPTDEESLQGLFNSSPRPIFHRPESLGTPPREVIKPVPVPTQKGVSKTPIRAPAPLGISVARLNGFVLVVVRADGNGMCFIENYGHVDSSVQVMGEGTSASVKGELSSIAECEAGAVGFGYAYMRADVIAKAQLNSDGGCKTNVNSGGSSASGVFGTGITVGTSGSVGGSAGCGGTKKVTPKQPAGGPQAPVPQPTSPTVTPAPKPTTPGPVVGGGSGTPGATPSAPSVPTPTTPSTQGGAGSPKGSGESGAEKEKKKKKEKKKYPFRRGMM